MPCAPKHKPTKRETTLYEATFLRTRTVAFLLSLSMNKEDKPENKPINSFAKFSGLGLQMLVTIGVGAWLGYKLDQYLGLEFPVFLLLFVFLLFGGVMYQLYRMLNK